MADVLRLSGIKIVCHKDHFDPEEDDHIWIPECARRGYVIVTSDKGIEVDPINRAAVLDSNAVVFILEEGSSRAVNWAASIIVSRNSIYQAVLKHKPPFFMSISKETGLLVKGLRRPCLVPESASRETMVIHESPISISAEVAANMAQ